MSPRRNDGIQWICRGEIHEPVRSDVARQHVCTKFSQSFGPSPPLGLKSEAFRLSINFLKDSASSSSFS